MDWATGAVQKIKNCRGGYEDIATDSITLNGEPFAVLSPNEPHKHLGVRMTMLGDFSAEKEHVCSEMRQRLALKAPRLRRIPYDPSEI